MNVGPVGPLQWGLALLGAVLLALLLAHNLWLARKARPPRQAPAAPREPSFGPSIGSSNGAPVPAAAPAEPDLPRRAPGQALSPLVDAIAPLRLDQPLAAATVLAQLPPTRRVGSKPMAVEALDQRSRAWMPVHLADHCIELQAGVQMANRSGPLNEIEYSEFVQKIQTLADAIGASAELPDMLDVVARARELDGFASQHDAQLVMRLQASGSAWSVGFIVQQAARLGFRAGALPGRLVLPAAEAGAPPVLSLQFDRLAALSDQASQTAVREVTLVFDVPQTPAALDPFNTWRQAGAALAQALAAQVSDDQGQPLVPDAFGLIGVELAGLYDKLDAAGLAAGSVAARRLFS